MYHEVPGRFSDGSTLAKTGGEVQVSCPGEGGPLGPAAAHQGDVEVPRILPAALDRSDVLDGGLGGHAMSCRELCAKQLAVVPGIAGGALVADVLSPADAGDERCPIPEGATGFGGDVRGGALQVSTDGALRDLWMTFSEPSQHVLATERLGQRGDCSFEESPDGHGSVDPGQPRTA